MCFNMVYSVSLYRSEYCTFCSLYVLVHGKTAITLSIEVLLKEGLSVFFIFYGMYKGVAVFKSLSTIYLFEIMTTDMNLT